MILEEFRRIVTEAKQRNPIWFALQTERPATDAEIQQAEWQLRTSLPEEYKEFVKEFGGGYFAFANVFSVASGGDWNIVDRNRKENLIGSGYVAISDPNTGDLYGFKSEDKRCRSQIMVLDHDSGEWHATRYQDLFEFLASTALKGE